MNETLAHYLSDLQPIQCCFEEAENALKNGEVPVGCVFLWLKNDGTQQIIAKAHNRTNELLCALKHAEMDCVQQVVNHFKVGHMEIFKQTVVLITLEPCIMCCRMLRTLQVKAVLFGARNDRFGGAGSVYDVHSDERIQCPPLNCISVLDADKAISLLQMFYEQTNEAVSKGRIQDYIKKAKIK